MGGGVSSAAYIAEEGFTLCEIVIIFFNDDIDPSLKVPRLLEVDVGAP